MALSRAKALESATVPEVIEAAAANPAHTQLPSRAGAGRQLVANYGGPSQTPVTTTMPCMFG